MHDVLARQKDIQYSSRTRLATDYFHDRHARDLMLKKALAKIPGDQLGDTERVEKARLETMSEATIPHLIYQQAAYETQAKDYESGRSSMIEHWNSGHQDTLRTLRHKSWLAAPTGHAGIVTHDIHRVDD